MTQFAEYLHRRLTNLSFARKFGADQARAEFAMLLARTRREARCTQQDLAQQIGHAQSYVAKLESGEANPTLKTVGDILAVLGKRIIMNTAPLSPHDPNEVRCLQEDEIKHKIPTSTWIRIEADTPVS